MQVNLTRIDIIVVGSAGGAYDELCSDYERRLSRYARIEVHVARGEPLQRGDDAVRAAEAARIGPLLDRLVVDSSTLVVACDSRGVVLDTMQLAGRLLDAPRLVAIIGGAAGLDRSILARCSLRLSFGAVTLPHQLARVVLTEQLYRSWRIARGEPYHH